MRIPNCLQLRPPDPWRSPALDVRDLVVRLETEGVSDAVALSEYGFEDTWRMADAVFLDPEVYPAEGSAIKEPSRVWAEYWKGPLSALPLLLSCLFIFSLRFALWRGELSPAGATAMAFGTVSSLVASGGFVQAMSRRGRLYARADQFRRDAYSTWRWFCWGAALLILLAWAAIGVNAYLDLLPSPLDALAAAVFLSLSLFWLATGILWTFELHALEAAAAALGIGAVCLLRQLLRIELPAALVLGVLAATVFALSGAAPALFRKSRGDKSPRRPVSFRRAFYLVSPHFAYGSFYYLFLFSDRLLAWSARAGRAAPFVQFRGDYEMGLGLGLAAFIVLVGWVRASTAHFDRRRQEAQKSFTIFRLAEFDSLLAGHYYKWAACFLPAAAAVSAAIYCTARLLGMFSNPAAERVALWALAGFPLVVLGLRNVSLLFSLARPLPALAAIILAWLADIGAGYALLQIGSYEHAVIGFTLGAAIFAGVSGYCLVHTIHRLDYYYFASAA